MSRESGFAVAFFGLGVLTPVLICSFVLTKVVASPDIVEPTVVVKEIEPSSIETFNLDYEQYGNYTIGNNVLRCTVKNSATNQYQSKVYLQTIDGEKISDEQVISPGGTVSMIDIYQQYDTVGKYSVDLVYEVLTAYGTSYIKCPYVILVNK